MNTEKNKSEAESQPSYEECLNRVKKIDSVIDMGFDSEMIEKFWEDIFSQCEGFVKKEKINLQIKK